MKTSAPRALTIALTTLTLTLLLALAFAGHAFSQSGWEKAYGGGYDDVSYSVQPTRDGGYVACGWTASFGPGTPTYSNVYLVKTDSLGDTLWTRVYGGPYDDGGRSVRLTQDGGYIIAGESDPYGTFYFNVTLIKTDSLGDTLWTKTYLDTTNLSAGNAVQQTRDTGYIIAGQIGGWDVYLIKTNPSGDTLWTRTYGGPYWDYGYAVQQTQDGGYIVAGERNFLGDSSELYLLKTNASGDSLWSKVFGGPASGMGGKGSVQQTQDGGYIIAGIHADPVRPKRLNGYLLKTDASGDTLWSRLYKPAGSDSDAGCFSVQEMQGGYILVGYTGYMANRDAFLIRTNTTGDILWTRTYPGLRTRTNQGMDVQKTQDGGYIIAGYTDFYSGNLDVYLIKTDSLGNVGVETPVRQVDGSTDRQLKATPNPFASFATVPGHEAERFDLYDITGRKVGIYKGDRVGVGLATGVYFLRTENGASKPVRIVKVR